MSRAPLGCYQTGRESSSHTCFRRLPGLNKIGSWKRDTPNHQEGLRVGRDYGILGSPLSKGADVPGLTWFRVNSPSRRRSVALPTSTHGFLGHLLSASLIPLGSNAFGYHCNRGAHQSYFLPKRCYCDGEKQRLTLPTQVCSHTCLEKLHLKQLSYGGRRGRWQRRREQNHPCHAESERCGFRPPPTPTPSPLAPGSCVLGQTEGSPRPPEEELTAASLSLLL